MQASAHQNGTWVAAVANCGIEEGVVMTAGTPIISPSGETVATTYTEGDELTTYECDLDLPPSYKETVFNF